jgi:RHS repeat-associated protein
MCREAQVPWAQGAHEAFGEAEVVTEAVENNLRFPGQYIDNETGLHYNYFRDYDSEMGRYVQSDPIGMWGGINVYRYSENNPTAFIDPFGLRGRTVRRNTNSWNRFLQQHGGRGYSQQQLSQLYRQLQLAQYTRPVNPELHEALEEVRPVKL